MKEIPVGHGKFAMVDDEDFSRLSKHKWHLLSGAPARRESALKNKKRPYIFMVREIMGKHPGMDIDHIDHNVCNNQKSNLRVCTHQQNLFNKRAHKGSVSKYKGVTLDYRKGKGKVYLYWQANIAKDGKHYWLGSFDTEEEAARAYDAKAKELFGEFAWFNFPGEQR